jgi:hypothetical protein
MTAAARIPSGAAVLKAGIPIESVSKRRNMPMNQNKVEAMAMGPGADIFTEELLGRILEFR